MNAQLVAPRRLIERWKGHDVRVLVDAPRIWLSAEDVEAATEIPPWGRGEQLIPDDGETERLLGDEYYLLDLVKTRCRIEGTSLCREFEIWLRQKRPLWVSPDVLEQAHQKPAFIDAYQVGEAAHLLGTGRTRLFHRLAELGWIERASGDGDWTITPEARVRDLLTTRSVTVGPGRKRPYAQIHVTVAGLDALRECAPAPPTPPPDPDPVPVAQPTLFD